MMLHLKARTSGRALTFLLGVTLVSTMMTIVGTPVRAAADPAAAVVSSLSVMFGSVSGGTEVTVTGSGFTGATAVTFDGVAGTGLSVVNDGTLVVTTPAHGEQDDADVVVMTANGASAAVPFTFVDFATSSVVYGKVTGPGGVSAGLGSVTFGSYWFAMGSEFETRSDGSFVQRLSGDDLKVCFSDFVGLAHACYDDGSGTDAAGLVHVGVGDVIDVSTQLAPAGSISGTVTGPGSIPTTAGWIQIYNTAGDFVWSGSVNGDGTYLLDDMGAGEYYLLFTESPGLAWSWSGGVNSLANAAPVTVAENVTTTYDMELIAGETITGKVTGPGGTPAPNAYVSLTNSDGIYLGDARADANGDYVTPPMLPGEYLALFSSYQDGLATKWSGGTSNIATASPVTVAQGSSTVYDMQLPYGGTINGSVTGPDGPVARGGFVDVYSTGGELVDWGPTSPGHTGYSGFYGDSGYEVGESYYVHARGFAGMEDQWYDNASAFATATAVTVTKGATTSANIELVPAIPAPAVTVVSPASGSTDGGTTVTLTGSHFTGATSVTFGGTAGTSVVVVSDTQITVVTPAHAAGVVDIVVTTPAGSSMADAYTYEAQWFLPRR